MFRASRPWHLLLLGVVGSCLAFGAMYALARSLLPPRAVPVTVAPVKTESRTLLLADLPTPPPANEAPIYLGDDLTQVPELKLEAPPAEEVARQGTLTTEQWKSRKTRQMAAALRLNDAEEDGFIKALLRTRPDLSGLPFLMGDACRTKGERAKAFKVMAERSSEQRRRRRAVSLPDESSAPRRLCQQAYVAVLAQTLPAMSCPTQFTMTHELASIDGPEATRELARVAVFSTNSHSRGAAIEGLADRPKEDSTEVLVAGLRYPWPEVAENAAHAIRELKRKDLIPQLEAVLADPDPRGPRTEKDGDREVTVAREVVRINHHRSCLLCHAPAEEGKTPWDALVAPVPLPSEPLPDPDRGYGSRKDPSPQSGLLVRIDVTYLRQDFSVVQSVEDSSAWRKRQRFDFFVRKRVLTPEEASDLRQRLKEADNSYRRVIAAVLRELKGSDS